MGYIFLALTILSETAAVLLMKAANGFEHRLWSILAVVAYLLSFIFLTLSLKTIPVGLANALWAGVSTILVAILGIFIFREQLSPWQFFFLALIVTGLIGLQLSEQPAR